ncbi:MAG: hypothetical protein WAX04_07595 [Oscillospiraceae bacterium]
MAHKEITYNQEQIDMLANDLDLAKSTLQEQLKILQSTDEGLLCTLEGKTHKSYKKRTTMVINNLKHSIGVLQKIIEQTTQANNAATELDKQLAVNSQKTGR